MDRKNITVLILAIVIFGYQNIAHSDFKITQSALIRNAPEMPRACPETLFRSDIGEIRVSPQEGRRRCTRRVLQGGLTKGEPKLCDGSRKEGFWTCSRTPFPFLNFSYVLPAGLHTLKNSVQESLPSSSPHVSRAPTALPSPTLPILPPSLPTLSATPPGTQHAGDTTTSRPTKISTEPSILLQHTDGTVLYASRADAVLPMASLTKLMTAAIVLDYGDLEDSVYISARAEDSEGDVATLREGEILPVRALLEAMLIASSNDAAIALEDYFTQKGLDLVSLMNERARIWSLENTVFKNPTGLDEPGHHSTARDLARLTRYLVTAPQYDPLWAITRTAQHSIISLNTSTRHDLENSNKLLQEIPFIIGGKTGKTAQAKECLMLILEKDAARYILVILGSEDRFKEARMLIKEYL